MASPPPPYDDITGISRTDNKHTPNVSAAQYDGNARPGELVVDLTTYSLYVGNSQGNLNVVGSGGGGHNIAGNRTVQLLYTCYDGTAANCYVAATYF